MKFKGYRLELKPNQSQRVLCAKSTGISRYAYNWKLRKHKEQYKKAKIESVDGKIKCNFGSAMSWHKEWVQLKNELPWIREVSKCCGPQALFDLENSFKRFFRKVSKFPKFKSKSKSNSFRVDGHVYVTSTYVQLPIIGKVRLKEKNYPSF